jgi:hypothetical protein
MIDITTVLNAESVSEFINGLPLTNTVGKLIFPAKKQMGIDITMIKGALNLPIVLKPSQFDTSVRIRSLRANITQETKEMPFFKEAVVIKEKDRQNLLMAMSAANVQWRNLILDNVYGNISGLVDGADVQAERMRMQLLSQGAINITTVDGDIVLDYGLPTANKETLLSTALWSDTVDSSPVDDIGRWQDLVEIATGVRPTRAICSRTTFRYIQKNQKIRLDVNYNGSTIITESIIKSYLQSKVGVSLEIIAGTFLAEDGVTALTYYPDAKFTLFPDGALGNTYYGTTPEEADLITGNAADVQIVRDGIAITTVKQTDPVTILTKVSQICLPSFEKVLQVFIATVA